MTHTQRLALTLFIALTPLTAWAQTTSTFHIPAQFRLGAVYFNNVEDAEYALLQMTPEELEALK
jgi:hypothetical protein